jgi:hypothetical protein
MHIENRIRPKVDDFRFFRSEARLPFQNTCLNMNLHSI